MIRPETVTRTPTEMLQQILSRDDSPTSASAAARAQRPSCPAVRRAVQRYTDGLQVAAEQLVGPQIVEMLDSRADQVVPELTSEPSADDAGTSARWRLRPGSIHSSTHWASGRELHTAGDMAAVLDWRLPEPAATDPGPLPWLPGIPTVLMIIPVWGQYLATRSEL